MNAHRGPSATAAEALFDASTETPDTAGPLAVSGPSPADSGSGGLENPTGTPGSAAGGPVVCGIDTSLTATGIASSDMWCDTRGHAGITTMPRDERLATMLRLVGEIAEAVGKPDLAVLEAPAFSRTAGGAHERAYLFWRLYEALTDRGVPIAVMSTNQRMLYATGKGSAAKGAIVDAVARRLPEFVTDGNDNKADAVILMAAGRDALGYPLSQMPAAHRKALDAVAWPEIGGAS